MLKILKFIWVNKWWLIVVICAFSVYLNVKSCKGKAKLKDENRGLKQTCIYLAEENKAKTNKDSTQQMQINELIMDKSMLVNSTNAFFKAIVKRLEENDAKLRNIENVFYTGFNSQDKFKAYFKDSLVEEIIGGVRRPTHINSIDLSDKWYTIIGSLKTDELGNEYLEGVKGYHCEIIQYAMKEPRKLKIWQKPMFWLYFKPRKVKQFINSDDPHATFDYPTYIEFIK